MHAPFNKLAFEINGYQPKKVSLKAHIVLIIARFTRPWKVQLKCGHWNNDWPVFWMARMKRFRPKVWISNISFISKLLVKSFFFFFFFEGGTQSIFAHGHPDSMCFDHLVEAINWKSFLHFQSLYQTHCNAHRCLIKYSKIHLIIKYHLKCKEQCLIINNYLKILNV